MEAKALFEALLAHGADREGIGDRFADNFTLYARCVEDFLKSPNVPELAEAIRECAYERAFDMAHSLKGLSGNLGLTEYYIAICALVESLRAERYDNVQAEYLLVEHAYENIRIICAGGQPKPLPAQQTADTQKSGADERAHGLSQRQKFILLASGSVLLVFIIAFLAFNLINREYQARTHTESGHHLLETGKQIGMYLDERIANDWRIVRGVGKSVTSSNITADDKAFLKIISEQRDAWNASEMMLYTENGYCVYADGTTIANDIASETTLEAHRNGSALSILNTTITYTLPLVTEQTLNGSRIVALSVVRNLETYLHEMDIISFNDKATIYMTNEDGIIISHLTKSDTPYVFNVQVLLEKFSVQNLDENSADNNVFSDVPATFYLSESAEDKYLVSVPISTDITGDIRLRLFYIVPERVINSASNTFSAQLTVFSVVIIAFLVGLSTAAFIAIYRDKKRQFDADLSARETMFDLLIQNTRTVFAFFHTDMPEPAYISANAEAVLDEKYWTIIKSGAGYRARSASGEESGMLAQVNALLSEWDGSGPFKSGYLCDDKTIPNAYFVMTIIPINEMGSSLVCIIQDMTAVHEREEAAREAMEMAKRSDEAKTRFLANMSHDIRTPMNAIMNMASFALDSADDPQMHEQYLRTILDSSEHLMRLINDVLDMSRIESGQTIISSEPFDLREVLREHIETIKPLCREKAQTLSVGMDSLQASAVRGDAVKVAQIIINLLSNAVKFTPRGGTVRFSATEIPSLREDMINVRFVVEDNGIGISPENLERIFEPFARAKDERVSSVEGTGLGLSICKCYVEAMGGTITCSSEEGKGSTFTVELFFQRESSGKSSVTCEFPKTSTPFLYMRCLLVEDNPINQNIARTLLTRIGFRVDIAQDGSEGVQMFERSPENTYDVIYMDIQMPVMDGLSATRAIRACAHPQAASVPILATSANVFVEDIEKARVAGMDGYIGKPIVTRELIEQTIKAISAKKGSAQ